MSNHKDRYINRDLSWIEFNKRVLFQALRPDVPLMEKFNFLSITGSNLDEFIMVRFSKLLQRMNYGICTDLNGLNPEEEYSLMLKGIKDFKHAQKHVYKILMGLLNAEDIKIYQYNELSKDNRSKLRNYFEDHIYPLISPIGYDTTKDFPEPISRQTNIIVTTEGKDGIESLSFIPIHKDLPKMVEVSEKGKEGYIPLYELIYGMIPEIFKGKKIKNIGRMRLYRDSYIDIERDNTIYLVDRMRDSLVKREFSQPVYVDFSSDTPDKMVKLIKKIFEIDKKHIWRESHIIDYSIFTKICKNKPRMWYKPFTPQQSAELIGEHDIFTAIDDDDIIVHHPYESFDPVLKFLDHASKDEDVLIIKQTLYRVSSKESDIVNSLCYAAKHGKSVTVAIELKARFDEGVNISLIDKLKLSGCKVVFGHDILKTHCKFISVIRRGKGGLRIYTHIGTGNYNEKTSKLYTDISYFTSNRKIGSDILTMFNIVNGFVEPDANSVDKIYFSPFNIRSQIYREIDKEIGFAKKNKEAKIILKCNSLSDKGIIDKLYEASEKGVKIILIVRGICSMKKINSNIEIHSVVGRFLEHSRIYYFHNNGENKLYISSADLLTRNLDHRFELMVPITDKECKDKLFKILINNYKEDANTFVMDNKGIFNYKGGKHNIHELLIQDAIDNYKMKTAPGLVGKKKNKKKDK